MAFIADLIEKDRHPSTDACARLSDSTFSNVEQQDIHYVKHTLRRWIEQTEQEMNLKMFGRESDLMVRFNVDSLLRGDLLTRMNAHATAVQNGIKTPNEVRHSEELEPLRSGDELLIQGATVPIGTQVGLTEGGLD